MTPVTPSVPLMRVTLAAYGRRLRVRLRFGAPLLIVRRDDWRRVALFAPGAVCCRLSWVANAYGTVAWTVIVMQAAMPFDAAQRIAGVAPGACLLLCTDGKPRVKTVLALIDAIEAAGIAPVVVSPDYWRTVANRLAARLPPPAYTPERHAAWLARRALQELRHA